MEHEFPFETSRPEKQDYLFRRFVALGDWFSPETTPEVLFHLLSNQTFRKLFVNGKQPTSDLTIYAKLLSYRCHIIMTHLQLSVCKIIRSLAQCCTGSPSSLSGPWSTHPTWLTFIKNSLHSNKNKKLYTYSVFLCVFCVQTAILLGMPFLIDDFSHSYELN